MYIALLILVTGGLVAVAAFFSVVGIASMFAYNYVPALIMGITLEAGKIAVAVYLYRYWRLMPEVFRGILASFLVVLMFITSVGIFGYLSQGYQRTSEEYKTIVLELKTLEEEHQTKKQREQEINRQIAQLPADELTGKLRLSREFSDELAELRDRLAQVTPRLLELRTKRLAFESHIGPIAYVAQMLNVSQDSIVFYAILLLVFVADPLAITLTVACNMVLIRSWDKRRLAPASSPTGSGFISGLIEQARSAALVNEGLAPSAARRAPPPRRRTTIAKKVARRR